MKTLTERTAAALAWIDSQLAICNAATDGPWIRCNTGDIFTDTEEARRGVEGNHVADCDPSGDKSVHCIRSDAAFIAAARTGYPEMLEGMKFAIEALSGLSTGRVEFGHLQDSADIALETILAKTEALQ